MKKFVFDISGVISKMAATVVFILAMGLTMPLMASAELVDRIVAVVNDDIILMSELEEAMTAISITLDQQGYTRSQQTRILHEQRPSVLGRLIDDKLTDQQVARHNIQVDEADIEVTIQRIMSANRMTEVELRRALKLGGTTYDDYRQEIRNRVLRARLLSREVQSKIVITDSDIRAYYNSHQDLYTAITKYDLRHILIRVSPGAGQMEKMRIYQQIHELHKRVQGGEAFDKLAEMYSQADSASQGGHLGVYSANSLTEQVRDALQGLAEKGFTDVLDTEQGYQVFYIEKIVRSGGKNLEEATPEIQEKMYADVVDQKFRSWLEELRQRSHIQTM